MIRRHILCGILSSLGVGGALPVALQASPLGYLGGSRSITTAHNSVSMYRAAADATGLEIGLSNVSIFGSASVAEVVTPSNIQISGYVYTPGGTNGVASWQNRTANAAVVAGATTLTTTAQPASVSGLHLIKFSSGELRWGDVTTGSSTYTWTAPLLSNATTAVQIKQPNSLFWTQTPILFDGGATTLDIAGGTRTIKFVNVSCTITKGLPFYVTLYVKEPTGATFTLPGQQLPNGQDLLNDGLLESYVDTATNNSTTYFGQSAWRVPAFGAGTYRPISVRGLNVTNSSYQPVTFLGDSISSNLTSWVQQFMHLNNIPYVHLGKAGEGPATYLAQSTIRSQCYSRGIFFVELGRNGYNITDLQALWANLRATGKCTKLIYACPPPLTTSSDGWTTEANQSQDTATRALNLQIIANIGQPGYPDAFMDIYTPVQGTDNLKWAAPNYTLDGTHPFGTAGQPAIMAYLASQNYQNLFV